MNTMLRSLFALLIAFSSGAYAQSAYNDVPEDHWAATAIDWVTSRGIMTGPTGPEPLFDPAGAVNRAQMATVLTRLHSSIESDLQKLELRIAQLEREGFLIEELLDKGPTVLQNP